MIIILKPNLEQVTGQEGQLGLTKKNSFKNDQNNVILIKDYILEIKDWVLFEFLS